MAHWLRAFETWGVEQLLRTPGFHRLAEKAAKNVHRIKHGLPREEPGGTQLEGQNGPGFMKHFLSEVKTQLGQAEAQQADVAKTGVRTYTTTGTSRATGPQEAAKQEETAHEVWEKIRQDIAQRKQEPANKSGFMGEYIDALRAQVRNNQKKG